MESIIHGVGFLVQLLAFAIFGRAIVSWLPIDKDGPVVQFLHAVTDPVIDPLRRVIPPIGMIDITPMIAMLVLFLIAGILSDYQA
ncbi:MAG: YggT family protein [Dehalococcoidia bacterium]